jgi:hypothetical protein
MSATVLGKCPGCKKTVRIPAEAAGKTVRCKHCGMICGVKPTGRPQARSAAAPQDPSATIPVVSPVGTPPSQPVPVAAPVGRVPPNVASAPMPVVQPAPDSRNAWSSITEDPSGQAGVVRVSPKYRKKGRGVIVAAIALFFLGICLAGTAYAILKIAKVYKEREAALAENKKDGVEGTDGDSGDSKIDKVGGVTPTKMQGPDRPTKLAPPSNAFPRRLLGISINNYIFANPTSYGHDSRGFIKRDFGETLLKLANKFRIAPNQVYELSDAAPEKKRIPPLKPIVEQTITRYLDGCRAQDRIILLLCAHTIEIEGKPYVVPLDGDLDDVKSLIPLEWIMNQLDKCKAQQKVLIADFNRYDRARGKERPSGGRLSASAEAMLKNPPEGVQVWSACSAGQYSFEFDDYYTFEPAGTKDAQGIKGGAFLSLFSVAFLQGIGGIQKAEDPLPIERLAQSVNANTMALSKEIDDPEGDAVESPTETKVDKKDEKKGDGKDPKKDAKNEATEAKSAPAKRKARQMPFLAGSMKGQPIAYNPEEPAPKALAIPTPEEVFEKGVMKPEEIRKILDLLTLPSIKQARTTASAVELEHVLPFMAAAMKDYRSDVTIEQIKKAPDKYPVRFAAIDALEKLRKVSAGDLALPTELRQSDRTDAAKANLGKLQRGPARVMETLDELTASLQKAAEERSEEKSKFWQATLDYAMAEVKARYVYVMEYTTMIGQVRKDNLPDLDTAKGQTGWRLASTNELICPSEYRDMDKEARKIFTKLGKDHPGTPWAVLAKRERFTALGLKWEPFGEATKSSEPAEPMMRK